MKKILSGIILTACITTTGVSALAGNITLQPEKKLCTVENNIEEIQPRGMPCGNCGIGTIITRTSYSDWMRTGEQRLCTHYPYGVDIKEFRNVTVISKCGVCGIGETSTSRQERWTCNGHF